MTRDLTECFRAEWSFARGLVRDLLKALRDEDLEYTPGRALGPLWKHFRHLGRLQENYLRALDTGSITFGFTGTSYRGGPSRKELLAYLDWLDAALEDRLRSFDPDQRINWFGETIEAHEHLTRMARHEVLHHGMFIVYLRLMGKAFPESWSEWGL